MNEVNVSFAIIRLTCPSKGRTTPMSPIEYKMADPDATYIAGDPMCDIIVAFGTDGYVLHLSGWTAAFAMVMFVGIVGLVTYGMYRCANFEIPDHWMRDNREMPTQDVEGCQRRRSRSRRSSSRR